jgi:predicted O-methyltransferase YrrM
MQDNDLVYGRKALKEGIPWITPGSFQVIESLVQPTWDVFEWGAGGSTCYWANKCNGIISVEHNPEWVTRVSKMLMERELHALLLPVRKGPGNTFHNYADAILRYSNESFDLVMVDGEASCRGRCLLNAMPKVRPGGILLLDNSNWLKKKFDPNVWTREDYIERDLEWVGQDGTFNWWTSIMRKAK